MRRRRVEFRAEVEFGDGIYMADIEAECVQGLPGSLIDPDEPAHCEEMEVWIETVAGWDDIADELSAEAWNRLEEMALELVNFDEDIGDPYDRANDR